MIAPRRRGVPGGEVRVGRLEAQAPELDQQQSEAEGDSDRATPGRAQRARHDDRPGEVQHQNPDLVAQGQQDVEPERASRRLGRPDLGLADHSPSMLAHWPPCSRRVAWPSWRSWRWRWRYGWCFSRSTPIPTRIPGWRRTAPRSRARSTITGGGLSPTSPRSTNLGNEQNVRAASAGPGIAGLPLRRRPSSVPGGDSRAAGRVGDAGRTMEDHRRALAALPAPHDRSSTH